MVKMKKPKVVLFDVSGTATRESFVEKVLLPYFKITVKPYLENNWQQTSCIDDVKALIKASLAQGEEAPKIDPNDDKSKQIEAILKYLYWAQEKEQTNTRAFCMFRFHVWFDGYDRGKLVTPVYSDVAVTITRWSTHNNIRLFILSNGWADATKKFMSKTTHGDLSLLVEGHFDSTDGSLTEAQTYSKVLEKMKLPAEDAVFLTKNPLEGRAAKEAGLQVVLVLTHRASVEMAMNLCKEIPIARTFTEIAFV